ncbi:unnamed protein product, partial [Cyprideis torosa]
AGGCCHSFTEKGFEFDIGIHYLGEVGCKAPNRTKILVDFITNGQLEFVPTSNNFDEVRLRYMDPDPSKTLSIKMQTAEEGGKMAWIEALQQQFPEEKETIQEFVSMVNKALRSMQSCFIVKALPLWLSQLLIKLGLVNWWYGHDKWMGTPIGKILDDLTSNEDLKAALVYICGDIGCNAEDGTFGMLAQLHRHYWRGSYYPLGGPSEIAFRIIPVIEAAGGKVLVRANVTAINVNSQGKVTGVTVQKGKSVYQVFVGFRGSTKDLNLPARNVWAFTSNDINGCLMKQERGPLEDQLDSDVRLMFVSFPSAKDPDFERRHPGKSVVVIVTFMNYDWFKEWEKTSYGKRDDEYEGLKKTLGDKMVEQLYVLFPQLEGKLEYVSFGSPLSHNYYLNVEGGEIYGLRQDINRFSLHNQAILRPQTGIPGLFMTGQDIAVVGFAGALYGGLFSASAVLGLDLFQDLSGAYQDLKAQWKTSEEIAKAAAESEHGVWGSISAICGPVDTSVSYCLESIEQCASTYFVSIEQDASTYLVKIEQSASTYLVSLEQYASTYLVSIEQDASTYLVKIEQCASTYLVSIVQDASTYLVKIEQCASTYLLRLAGMANLMASLLIALVVAALGVQGQS